MIKEEQIMIIAVGSTNPAKIEAAEKIFINDEIIGCHVPSDVSEQPFSDEETIRGAINRAKHALEFNEGEIAIGLEGGVTETPYGLMLCNWGALLQRNDPDTPFIAGGARILLPKEISVRLKNGDELGPVMDEYCQRENIRKHEGAVGIFTNGAVNRREMFSHVILLLKGQWEYWLQSQSFDV